jgi:hypothetical protein
MTTTEFGYADADGNVFIKEGSSERKVGQLPGKTSEEALAFFMRKFDDFTTQVRILEQRVASKADPESIEKSHAKLTAELVSPNVVGDVAALRARLVALEASFAEIREAKRVANAEASAKALAAREEIVKKAEAMAQADHKKTIWKTASVEFASLFDAWQSIQKTGAKVSKTEADLLWKRFSVARTTFETAKRAFFAAADSTAKEAKAKRTALVESAEKLAEKSEDGSVEYRKILDQWKATPRSTSKVDDALWLRLKAAGDKIYADKAAKNAELSVEFAAAKQAKFELLELAKKIDPSKSLVEAKKSLADIQKRWEKAGKVAREDIRPLEDALRAVEKLVRDFESEQWRKTDPAAKARSESVIGQLEDSISKLEKQLADAQATKNEASIKAAKEALEARQAWLEVVRKTTA